MQAVWAIKDVPIGRTLLALAKFLAETLIVNRDRLPNRIRKRFDIGAFDEAPKLEASVIANDVLTQNQGLMSKVELGTCSSGVNLNVDNTALCTPSASSIAFVALLSGS